MTFIVGLTGGIGSGKTTVANKFAERGVPLVDADIIARDVVAPNSHGLNKIAERYGSDILMTDQQLDRGKLRQIIFDTPTEKAWLDNLLHPLIRKEMAAQLEAITAPYCLLVVPLLVENGLQDMAHRVLVVDVSVENQIKRTTSRDSVSSEHVNKIVNLQATQQQRLEIADDVIHNDSDEEALDQQIDTLHQHYLSCTNR